MKKLLGIILSLGLSTSLMADFNPSEIITKKQIQPNDIKYTLRHDLNKCDLTDGAIQIIVVYEYNMDEYNLITKLNEYKNSYPLPKGKYIETYTASSDTYNQFFTNIKDCDIFRINYNKYIR